MCTLVPRDRFNTNVYNADVDTTPPDLHSLALPARQHNLNKSVYIFFAAP